MSLAEFPNQEHAVSSFKAAELRAFLDMDEESPFPQDRDEYVRKAKESNRQHLQEKRRSYREAFRNRYAEGMAEQDSHFERKDAQAPTILNPVQWVKRKLLLQAAGENSRALLPLLQLFEKREYHIMYKKLQKAETLDNLLRVAELPEAVVRQALRRLNMLGHHIEIQCFSSAEFADYFVQMASLSEERFLESVSNMAQDRCLYLEAGLFNNNFSELTDSGRIFFNLLLNGAIPESFQRYIDKAAQFTDYFETNVIPMVKEGKLVHELVTLDSVISPEFIANAEPDIAYILQLLMYQKSVLGYGVKALYFYETLTGLKELAVLDDLIFLLELGVDVSGIFTWKNTTREEMEALAERVRKAKGIFADPEKRAWIEISVEKMDERRDKRAILLEDILHYEEVEKSIPVIQDISAIVHFIKQQAAEFFPDDSGLLNFNVHDHMFYRQDFGSEVLELQQYVLTDGFVPWARQVNKSLSPWAEPGSYSLSLYLAMLFNTTAEISWHNSYETYKLKFSDLPIFVYLAEHSDQIPELIRIGSASVELLQAIAIKAIPVDDETVVRWLSSSLATAEVDPKQIMPYISQLPLSTVLKIAEKHEIAYLEEAGLPQELRLALLYIKSLSPDITAHLQNYKPDPFSLFSNGKPKEAFFNYLLTAQDTLEIAPLLTDEVLSQFSFAERTFWSKYRSGTQSLRVLLKSSKQELQLMLARLEQSPESIETYFRLFEAVAESPSREVQHFKVQIIQQLLEVENPMAKYREIEEIFVANNLPTLGKVFKVFQVLNPPDAVELILQNEDLSAVLRATEQEQRERLILRDLLKVAIENNNRSLKKYLEFFQNNGLLLQKYEEAGWQRLSEWEQQAVYAVLRKALTLLQSTGGIEASDAIYIHNEPSDGFAKEALALLRNSLSIPADTLLSEGVIQFFTRDFSFSTIREILEHMDHSRKEAHERGLRNAELVRTGGLQLQAGDLLKSVNEHFFQLIAENGSLAKEYLGPSAGSDSTPFDTDTSQVLQRDVTESKQQDDVSETEYIFGKSLSGGSSYGNLKLIFKNRGQFFPTSSDSALKPEEIQENSDKYELIDSSALAKERHFGIRTGIPFTEVDYVLVQPTLAQNPAKMDEIFFVIAEHNHYVPVLDHTGILIFSPEMYEEYRSVFNGIPEYSEKDVEVRTIHASNPFFEEVQQLKEQTAENIEQVSRMQKKLRSIIEQVLSEFSIPIQGEFSQHLLEAEMHDTGSTGRYTNQPGDYDFDILLRLDSLSYRNEQQMVDRLLELLRPARHEIQKREGKDDVLVKAFGAEGIEDGLAVDVDIFIVKKSEEKPFATHEAVEEKLRNIREKQGESVYQEVIANIVLMKRLLKEAGAYKKKDGGFGGVGTENWILQSGGSVESAFSAFWEASHEGDAVLPLLEFKRRYRLLDPGKDLARHGHDNFIAFLSDQAYEKILEMIAKSG